MADRSTGKGHRMRRDTRAPRARTGKKKDTEPAKRSVRLLPFESSLKNEGLVIFFRFELYIKV